MARSMVARSKMLLLRETKRGQCCLNNLVGVDQERLKDQLEKRIKPSWWVPHPRSGIYYPMGHERVMDDVPEGAAHSDLTYWLRGSEGVDEPSNDPSFDGQ
ncbi:uncharacterized protein LOC131219013 [Magnolia sinica]|uniref:uncharacterized protein LOC131219013 n=1 Tax=Magnolia sinica TaxID=86752 RepID=UPI00265944D1|nr:uncharacterized protein LOC131219013 [Magnolia sinica]